MKKFISTLTVTIGTALTLALTGINPAQAITFNFEWNGDRGYSATGSFSYDENTAPATFSESGPGATQVLQSLNVSLFDPFKNFIAAYDNVVNGSSTGNFFQFNFNTVTQEIFGSIDLGGEGAGDTYLQGTVNTKLSLFHVAQSGSDEIKDSNSGTLVVKPVPESSSIMGLLVFSAVGGAVCQIKRQPKY